MNCNFYSLLFIFTWITWILPLYMYTLEPQPEQPQLGVCCVIPMPTRTLSHWARGAAERGWCVEPAGVNETGGDGEKHDG